MDELTIEDPSFKLKLMSLFFTLYVPQLVCDSPDLLLDCLLLDLAEFDLVCCVIIKGEHIGFF